MAKRNVILPEDKQKELLFLKSTYEMHCKTREEALLRGKTQNIDKIDKIINETLTSIAQIDPKFAQKCAQEQAEKMKRFNLMDALNVDDESSDIFDVIGEEPVAEEIDDDEIKKQTEDFYSQFTEDEPDLYQMADNLQDEKEQEIVKEQINPEETNDKPFAVSNDEQMFNDIDPNAQYDIIPLPSKGECYVTKTDRIPVAYLTAADENLITSPNLYESGNITSILLKKKVLGKNINVENLISGDVDAIMVFLRGTSYGNEFPVVATDPKTGEKVETTVDLSKLKYKPFTLKGDENGLFDFTLPRTGTRIKFKFLTKKEEKMLQKLNKQEAQGVAIYDIKEAIEKIKDSLQIDDKLNDAERNQIIDANDKLQKWVDNLSKNKKSLPYTKTITNTMEMQIVSVNGNTDRKFIHNFVMNMPANDSLAFRRYVYDNQPGVDFEVDVERPVSLGGGTFKCFLEWDDYVFWHIA